MLAGCGPLISLDLLEPKGLGLDCLLSHNGGATPPRGDARDREKGMEHGAAHES